MCKAALALQIGAAGGVRLKSCCASREDGVVDQPLCGIHIFDPLMQ